MIEDEEFGYPNQSFILYADNNSDRNTHPWESIVLTKNSSAYILLKSDEER